MMVAVVVVVKKELHHYGVCSLRLSQLLNKCPWQSDYITLTDCR